MKVLEDEQDVVNCVFVFLAVEVSLISPGWLVTNTRTRIASIKVNNKEMAKNDLGMNVVVFNYLSGRSKNLSFVN